MNSSIVPCFASNKCDINSLENDFTWNIWQWKCLELAKLETFVRDIGTFLKDYSTLCVTSLFANPFHHVRDPRWILALFLFSRTFLFFSSFHLIWLVEIFCSQPIKRHLYVYKHKIQSYCMGLIFPNLNIHSHASLFLLHLGLRTVIHDINLLRKLHLVNC